MQFGVDGGAYVLDWVRGWDKTGQGRIYRVHDPATDASAPVRAHEEAARRGHGAAARRGADRAPRRARPARAAGRAICARGERRCRAPGAHRRGECRRRCSRACTPSGRSGQIGRRQPQRVRAARGAGTDREPEVRAQAAKVLGESGQPGDADQLVLLLQDPEPRVRFFAALALGRLHRCGAVQPLVDLLRRGVGGDAYLRHAARASRSASARRRPSSPRSRTIPSDDVRAGMLLALRRQHSPEVATFLQDASPQLGARSRARDPR